MCGGSGTCFYVARCMFLSGTEQSLRCWTPWLLLKCGLCRLKLITNHLPLPPRVYPMSTSRDVSDQAFPTFHMRNTDVAGRPGTRLGEWNAHAYVSIIIKHTQKYTLDFHTQNYCMDLQGENFNFLGFRFEEVLQ